MDYFKGVVKAIVPRKGKDIVAVSILVSAFVFVGYKAVLQEAPATQIRTETTYPREAHRNGFFYLNFDISFGASCLISARRYIVGSDGVEYLVQEDSKEVIKDEPMKYTVRIPVMPSIPLGNGFIRSDFEYGCDWWGRHIKSIKREGRMRPVNILPAVEPYSNRVGMLNKSSMCDLPEEPGMAVVKAHYRRLPGYIKTVNASLD